MNKEEMIVYLGRIKKYLNLRQICQLYNYEHEDTPIDYNNLRQVVNRNSTTRLSEEKLRFFILFLHERLFVEIFECKENDYIVSDDMLSEVVEQSLMQFKRNILEGIKNEISSKK